MTFSIASGWAIIDRWGASIFVMWAPACFAMSSWPASGMALSAVPTTAHDGIVFHAGGPDLSVSALNVIGLWVAARTAAAFRDVLPASASLNTLGLTYRSASPAGAPGTARG